MRWIAMGVGLAGCTSGSGDTGDTDTGIAGCAPPSEPTVVATGYERGTEGIAVGPDGTLYVTSRDDFVDAVAPDGTVSKLADVLDPLGAVWWNDALWVASGGLGDTDAALVEITASGTLTSHPIPTVEQPNFLAPTPWGTLLVSDDSVDVISEWRGEDDLITWSTDVSSPNGMAFSADGSTLYAASTFRDPGLYAVAIDGEAAGALSTLATFDITDTPDGIAVADDGSVYVALNLSSEVVRYDDGATEVVATPPYPASLAWGKGARDECHLFVTSLFGEDVTELAPP